MVLLDALPATYSTTLNRRRSVLFTPAPELPQTETKAAAELSGETLPRQQRIHVASRVKERGRSPGR